MFLDFWLALRDEGLDVGTGQWLVFLSALSQGLALGSDELYGLGRALLCRSETEYDSYDVAFASTFEGVTFPAPLREALMAWLDGIKASEGELVELDPKTMAELLANFEETLKKQTERHDGGNRWVGTGGTSPHGHGGRSRNGLKVGGDGGGGRSGVNLAMERAWQGYRGDRVLDVRELRVVLRSLRSLTRDGAWALDLDETIDQTAKNAGDIAIIERRERKNRLKVVLFMDAGGSMMPHAEKVERLFSAAKEVKTFREFTSYTFHNCVYGSVYTDIEQLERKKTHEVLANLTPEHRLIFVGDASMAPYELFSPFSWPGNGDGLSGLEWLRRFRERCPGAIWLNPDPEKWWDHPTVRAIGGLFPMFPLTVEGLEDGVRKLRAPR